MHKEKCDCCKGTGNKTVFSEKDWDEFLKWKRATDKQFVIDENTHGEGFVMIDVKKMEDTYNQWSTNEHL